jgi:hypothetical protein
MGVTRRGDAWEMLGEATEGMLGAQCMVSVPLVCSLLISLGSWARSGVYMVRRSRMTRVRRGWAWQIVWKDARVHPK